MDDMRQIYTLLQNFAEKKELPHKIWADCIHCSMFPDCDEEVLMYQVRDAVV